VSFKLLRRNAPEGAAYQENSVSLLRVSLELRVGNGFYIGDIVRSRSNWIDHPM
jgi:hypothetical protein